MSTVKRIWAAGFYWIGMAMTLACFAFVLAGNTELVWRFEHTRLPLSWMFAGGAVFAFLAVEFSDSTFSLQGEAENRSAKISSEWEAAEF
jgi:hypothetical protein